MTDASDRVLEAAAEEFARSGYEGATVRDIARRCEMSPGSLFHRHASKRELLVAVVAEGTVRALDHVTRELRGVSDPAQRLRTLVVSHLTNIHGENRAFTLMSSREFYLLDEAERQRVVAVRDAYEAVWQSVLDEAADAGLVPRDPLFRLFLLGAVNQTFFWFHPSAELDITALGERFVAMATQASTDVAAAARDVRIA